MKKKYIFLFLNILSILSATEKKVNIDESIILIFFFIIFIIVFVLGIFLGRIFGKKEAKIIFEKEIPNIRQDAIEKSRAVLSGQFSEQLAPYLPDFPYVPTEVRFLGKPIDFIVFKGLDEKNITEIIFVEVKSGKSKLNTNERSLKNAVIEKKIKWEEYRIPDDLTKKLY